MTDDANHTLVVIFDDARTGVGAIKQALSEKGYPPEGEPVWLSSAEKVALGEGQEKMLVGKVTKEELYREFPVFEKNARNYFPREEVIRKISGIDEKIEIVMFLGTWCKDSVSEAPKLLKVYERADNPKFSLEIYGVDRKKKEGSGLCERYDIQRVPTVLFFKAGKELGRIIEYPEKSVEEDLLEIVIQGGGSFKCSR